MELLTFGSVVEFETNYYVWLVVDTEDDKLHLARILDKEKTKELIGLDKSSEKRHTSSSGASDNPMFAYVVLTTENFDGCAAFLKDSDNHADHRDSFSVLGTLNKEDVTNLRQRILGGAGLPTKLIKLVKSLGNE